MANLTIKHEPCGHYVKRGYTSGNNNADLNRLTAALSVKDWSGGIAISSIPCSKCRASAPAPVADRPCPRCGTYCYGDAGADCS